MTGEEAFERGFHAGRETKLPGGVDEPWWSWVEEQFNGAAIEGDLVKLGYWSGRLSLRGEAIADEQGFLYTYGE